MKQSYRKIFFIAILALVGFASCKKDIPKATIDPNASTTLAASATNLQLNSGNSTSTAANFSWSAVDFSFEAPVNYNLEFSASSAFTSPVVKAIGADILQMAYTGAEMNTIAKSLNLTAGNAGAVYVRTKALLNQYTGALSSVTPVVSNALVLTVTPY